MLYFPRSRQPGELCAHKAALNNVAQLEAHQEHQLIVLLNFFDNKLHKHYKPTLVSYIEFIVNSKMADLQINKFAYAVYYSIDIMLNLFD